MTRKGIVKNKSVLKAMCIGLSAMMTLAPSVNVFADEFGSMDPGFDPSTEDAFKGEEQITQPTHEEEVKEYEQYASEPSHEEKSDDGSVVTEESKDLNINFNDADHEYKDTTEKDKLFEALHNGEKYIDGDHSADIYPDFDKMNIFDKEAWDEILSETDYEIGEKQGVIDVEEDKEEKLVKTETKSVSVSHGDVVWGEPETKDITNAEGKVVATTTTTKGECEVTVSSSDRVEKEYNAIATKETTQVAPVTSDVTPDEMAAKLAGLGITKNSETGLYESSNPNVTVSQDTDGTIKVIVNTVIKEEVTPGVEGELETGKTTTEVAKDGTVTVTYEKEVTDSKGYVFDVFEKTVTESCIITTVTKPAEKTETITFKSNQEEVGKKKADVKKNNEAKATELDGKIDTISDDDEVKKLLKDQAKDLFAALGEDDKVTETTVTKTDKGTVNDDKDGSNTISSKTTKDVLDFDGIEITSGTYEGFTQLSEEDGEAEFEKAKTLWQKYKAAIEGKKDAGSWVTVEYEGKNYEICASWDKVDGSADHAITYSIRLADEKSTPELVKAAGEENKDVSVTQDPTTKVVTKTTTITQDGAVYRTTSVTDKIQTITVVKNSNGKEKVTGTVTVDKAVKFEGETLDTTVKATENVDLTVKDGKVSTTDDTVPEAVISAINNAIAGDKKDLSVTLKKGNEEGEKTETGHTDTKDSASTSSDVKLADTVVEAEKDITSSEYYQKLQEYRAIEGTTTETVDGRDYIVETAIEEKDGKVIITQTRTLQNADDYAVVTGSNTDIGTEIKTAGPSDKTGVSEDKDKYVIETTTEFSRTDEHSETSKIAGIQEVITITLTKETTKKDHIEGSTNGYDYTGATVKNLNKDGSTIITDENKSQAVINLMNSLNVAADDVVYANTFNPQCNHTEGYICVNTLDVKNGYLDIQVSNVTAKYSKTGFAYIGSTDDTIVLKPQSGAEGYIIVPKELLPENVSEDSNGYAFSIGEDGKLYFAEADRNSYKNADPSTGELRSDLKEMIDKALPELQKKYDNSKDIINNLSGIASLANSIIGTEKPSLEDQKKSLQKVVTELNEGKITGDDIVTIDISSDLLTGNTDDLHNYMLNNHLIDKILSANESIGATVVFNIIVDDPTTTIVIDDRFQNDFKTPETSYRRNTGNIVWNFGNVENIESKQLGGVIVAPNADVKIFKLDSGRIIAKSVASEDEVHQDITDNKTTTSFKIESNKEIYDKVISKEWTETVTSKKVDTTVFEAQFSYKDEIKEKGKGYFIKGDTSALETVIDTWTNKKSVATEEYSLDIKHEKDKIDLKYEMEDKAEIVTEKSETKKESILTTIAGKVKLALEDVKTTEVPPETPPTPPETPPTTPPETPPTPPETPPTPPETPPTPPETPPTTPPETPPTTPPETPPTTPPETPPTPDTPEETPGTPEVPGTPDVTAVAEATPAGVLGARTGRSAGVLGARKKAGVLGEKRVLGARTGDTANLPVAYGILVGSVAMAGAWIVMRRKKREE